MNDAIAALVRRNDPDRFLTALFAPPDRRDALLTLYAFNHELARAREVASLPPLALIRLQWWREVVKGASKPHEVATPLSSLLQGCTALAADLEAMITVREQEVECPVQTLDQWRQAALHGAGSLAVAAARLLGAESPEIVRRFGAAYAVAGQLRTTRLRAAQGHCLVPAALLAENGLTQDAAIATPDHPAMLHSLATLVREGQAFLVGNRTVPKPLITAALPATLARRDFMRWLRRPGTVVLQRGIGDKMSVLRAAVTGRL